jgi:hypothetical protein
MGCLEPMPMANPIHALLFHADCDRFSLEYIEAIGRLLNANPESSIGLFS